MLKCFSIPCVRSLKPTRANKSDPFHLPFSPYPFTLPSIVILHPFYIQKHANFDSFNIPKTEMVPLSGGSINLWSYMEYDLEIIRCIYVQAKPLYERTRSENILKYTNFILKDLNGRIALLYLIDLHVYNDSKKE